MTLPTLNTLFLHRDLPFHGGVAKSFLYYARYRDPKRVRMWAGSFDEPTPEMVEALGKAGAEVITLGDQGYFLPTSKLERFIKAHDVDVIVCGSFKSYLVAKLACWRSSCRVIFWIPGIPLTISGRLRRWLFRLLARRDTVVFISEAVKRAHAYPGHRGKSLVVNYGIEDYTGNPTLTPYAPEQRKRFGFNSEDILIGYIAEFIAWKDHRTLLTAFDEVAKRCPKLHLLLIGTGQDFAKVKAEAVLLDAGERVHFLGSREDARRILGLLDLYVHPSRGEGFGLAVAEAMLAHLPVIAADEGALPEFVHQGETGLVFKAGNAADLTEKIWTLLQDPGRRQELGRRARSYCLGNFAPSRFAEELTQVLEDEIRNEHA